MKRKTITIMTILLMPLFLFAAERTDASLYFTAEVPEDWGVSYPDDALRLDDLFFEIKGTEDDGSLVGKEGNIQTVFLGGHDSVTLDLLYYGNKSDTYRFEVSVLESDNWQSDGEPIDVDVSFLPYVGSDGIISTSPYSDRSSLVVEIPPTGPRRGEKCGSIVVEWTSDMDIAPGAYDLRVDLVMRSVE